MKKEISINLNIHDSDLKDSKGSFSILLKQHVGSAKDDSNNIEYELSSNWNGTAMMINAKGSSITYYITYDDLFEALEKANIILK
jgi:hypothetical protein